MAGTEFKVRTESGGNLITPFIIQLKMGTNSFTIKWLERGHKNDSVNDSSNDVQANRHRKVLADSDFDLKIFYLCSARPATLQSYLTKCYKPTKHSPMIPLSLDKDYVGEDQSNTIIASFSPPKMAVMRPKRWGWSVLILTTRWNVSSGKSSAILATASRHWRRKCCHSVSS